MDKTSIQRAYDSVLPSQAEKDKMLKNILSRSATRRSRPLRRTLCIGLAAALLMAFGATAYANDWFGLNTYIMGQHILHPGEEYQSQFISLQGYEDSPEYMALREWMDFLDSYDADGSILAAVGNEPTELDERYSGYLCYTQEMADTIDKICEKYSLALLDSPQFPQAMEELYALADTGDILRRGADFENSAYPDYVYGCGSFQFCGSAHLLDAELDWPFDIEYQFSRRVKGYFDEIYLDIGHADEYTQWNYTTENGVELLLAQSPYKELIIADLESSFVVINLYDVYVGDIVLGELHKSPEALEAFAELFDFSVIP